MLKRLANIALSNTDITDLLDDKVKILLYPDIIKFKTIDELLKPFGAVIILFESKPNYGHWCAIWKLNKNTVSFFNSYGGYPDDSLLHIDEGFRWISNQKYPYLSHLLVQSPYNLTYNEYNYQAHSQDIKTCGRWCVLRILLRDLNDDQFHKFVVDNIRRYHITPDELVTLLTTI